MAKFHEGKSFIVTGAGSGLGEETAQLLASEGAQLVLVDLNEAALERVKDAILSQNPDSDIVTLAGDVSDEAVAEAYTKLAVDKFGKIDGFFNNAGIEGKQNLTENFGSDEFAKVIAVNLNGVFYGMKHVLAVMREQGHGSIVNSASVGGIRGVGNQSGYSASKHGVVGLTRNSAVEYGQYNVRINAIAPGAIMTQMVIDSLKQMDADNWEAAGAAFVQANPMKRFGKPEEISHVVSFLFSDGASFINGQVIAIDGGQSQKY